MITLKDALELVLKEVKLMPIERIDLFSCYGRILAEDIISDIDIPSFDRAAMDGYAINSISTLSASPQNPVILKVIEEIPAGKKPNKKILINECSMIMTGSLMPEGSDSVVMLEEVETLSNSEGKFIKIKREIKKGENVSYKGEDIKKGELILSSGIKLEPNHIGILGSLGYKNVIVRKRPKVGILITGNEIISPGKKLTFGKIYDANSYSLYSLIIKYGGIPVYLGISKDDYTSLETKIKQGLKNDILLISGGVSEGNYDLVIDVLKKLKVKQIFWKVAIKPGKPVFFGKKGKTLIFGLPGYPVSAFLNFQNLVRPCILKMLGQEKIEKKKIKAILTQTIENKGDRLSFIRVKLKEENGKIFADVFPKQKSGILKSIVFCDGVVNLPVGSEIRQGEEVEVELLF